MKKIIIRIALVIFVISFLLFFLRQHQELNGQKEKINSIIDTNEQIAEKAVKESKLLLIMTAKVVEINARIQALEKENKQQSADIKVLQSDLKKLKEKAAEAESKEDTVPVPNLKLLIPIGDEK